MNARTAALYGRASHSTEASRFLEEGVRRSMAPGSFSCQAMRSQNCRADEVLLSNRSRLPHPNPAPPNPSWLPQGMLMKKEPGNLCETMNLLKK